MSSFGRGGRHHSSRGSSGRGGRHSYSGRGGGGSYGGGRGHTNQSDNKTNASPPLLKLCSHFTTTGACPNRNCDFSHVIKMHAQIDNSDPMPPSASSPDSSNVGHHQRRQNNNNTGKILYPTTDVAIWNNQNVIKIFSSSHDGKWRLYNTANGAFNLEVQHNMGGKVQTLCVVNNFLFCGFEGTSVKIPGVSVGMIHAWNLNSPTDPPMEFWMMGGSGATTTTPTSNLNGGASSTLDHGSLAPFAHASIVTAFGTYGTLCFSGSRDGVIRIWKFEPTLNGNKGGFILHKVCCGHAGEITGLVMVPSNGMLWSCSTDKTIRLWDGGTDGNGSWECKYLITMNTPPSNVPPQSPSSGAAPTGVGHSDAITSLILFESPAGTFVLSASLDGNVKVWNSNNGECLSTTDHGMGIVSMALSSDTTGNPILICGTVMGKMMIRSLMESMTMKTPPMCLLCTIDARYTFCGHEGVVNSIKSGPGNTFYSGGEDGKIFVWQITGGFGL